MIILQETAELQEIIFISREDECTHIIVNDEEQNTSTTYNCTMYSFGEYNAIELVLNLRNGKHYTIDIYNNTNVVYKDKIFCTNQDIESFSINDSEYTSKDSNNDYITL